MSLLKRPHGHVDLLEEIAPDVEALYNRHLEAPRDWFPHEAVNWGTGRDFSESPWSAEDYPLPAGVRSAIYVNLLTEDNLPYYTNTLLSHSNAGHPLADWNHQWTMEENRHAMVMRDWVHISRCIDPVLLEEGRRVQMKTGEGPHPESLADLITYVAFQERATQIAHRNTATKLPKEDVMGRRILGLIAGDETKHYMFYRDLAKAAFVIDPSAMMIAATKQAMSFAMPGTGIPGFTRHAVRIAREGIYGLSQFLGDVLEPVTAWWDLDHLAGLSAEAERARDEMAKLTATLHDQVEKVAERLSLGRSALA